MSRENRSKLKEANECLRLGEWERSIALYRAVALESPELGMLVEQNLRYIDRKLKNEAESGVAPSETALHSSDQEDQDIAERSILADLGDGTCNASPGRRLAILFHIFHEEVVGEILLRMDSIPIVFDLYVTTPLSKDSAALALVAEKYPDFVYIYCPNRGRDILPFLKIYDRLIRYDVCLKLHTKRGLTNFGDMWRQMSLDSLLASEQAVSNILKAFQSNSDLVVAGPRCFYSSGRRLMHGNHANIVRLCDTLGIQYSEDRDWAFFAGTMFWFRPSLYADVYEHLLLAKFEKEAGQQDGGIEHSIERIFGLIPSYKGRLAGLLGASNDATSLEIVRLPDGASLDDPTASLSKVAKARLVSARIYGDVNKQSSGALADRKVRGWLARLNEDAPRRYTLRIGSSEFVGVANIYRADLEENDVNSGCHAFEVSVPLKYQDGAEYIATLFDTEMGLPVASNKYRWQALKRPYADLSEYLAWAYCGQYVSIPFVEEDKRVFASMEVIANDLEGVARRLEIAPLVSIVMPVHNRATEISNAIESVLCQSYKNWELIIVDDHSTDDTASIIESYTDRRIKSFRNVKNLGVSKSRNVGLEEIRGEFVSYLDSDNTWDSRYLSAMMAAWTSKLSNSDAIYCGQLVYVGVDKLLDGARFGPFNKSLLWNNNYIDLNCFMHKRGVLSSVGVFDTNLRRFVDWDFIVRISKGHSIAGIPVLLSNYYLNSTDNSITGNDKLSVDIEIVREKIEAARKLDWGDDELCLASSDRPGVSVIIPSYEALQDLKNCISSLQPILESSPLSEICIVDNSSRPEVVDFIRLYRDANPGRVTVIELERNFGFTYAVNEGLKVAKSENDVLILSNDAILSKSCVPKLQAALYEDASAGLAVPAQLLPANTETICSHVPYAVPEEQVDVNISVHHRNLKQMPLFYDGRRLNVDFAPFFCVLIKADTRRKIPLLDQANGRHYRSDRTYCNIARMLYGLNVIYVPNALVQHGLQKSTRELRAREGEHSERFKNIFIDNSWSSTEQEEYSIVQAIWNRNF